MNRMHWQGRWDPFRDLTREMNRLFEAVEPLATGRMPRAFPPLNLADRGEAFEVTAEVPGMSPEDLDLSISGETLTLRGERKRPEGVAEDSYRRQERPFGRWSRSVTLPGRVDVSQVSADFGLGVLTVVLPKVEETQPRQITVTNKTS